ncbi:MAG: glutathione binding-like protein, partial [Gammaproteobacteria bacterium]
ALPISVARANNRQFRYRIVRDLYSLADELEGDNDIAAANARKSMRDNLLALAPVFSQFSYFMSDEFSLVDLCMAPLLWRLPRYGVKLGSPAKPLLKYAARLFDRRAYHLSLSPFEQHIR